jgi:hypothetical protein
MAGTGSGTDGATDISGFSGVSTGGGEYMD